MTSIILSLLKFIKSASDFMVPDALFNLDIFTNFTEYFDFFVDMLVKINFLVPLPTLFSCVGIIVSIRVVKIVIYIQNWLIRSVLDVIP